MKETKKILKSLTQKKTMPVGEKTQVQMKKSLRDRLFEKYGDANGVDQAICELYDEFKRSK